MSSATLPELPNVPDGVRVAQTGHSARLLLADEPIRIAPELMIESTVSQLRAHGVTLTPDPSMPDAYRIGDWCAFVVPEIEAALAQRSINVEAVGVLPDETVVDPHGCVEEIHAGIIRVLSDEVKSDPLLGLKVITARVETGGTADGVTTDQLTEWMDKVLTADRSRIRYWLTRLLVSRDPGQGLQLMKETKALDYLLPEVAAFVDFHRSSKHHHKDVWAHTVQVVCQAVPRPVIRWAALLHDIGKVHTRSFSGGGKVHFLKHDEVGAYMFDGIAARLRFPEEPAKRIHDLILHHLRPAMYDPKWSDSAVRRFSNQLGDIVPDLLSLARADITSKRPGTRRRALFRLDQLKTRIHEVAQQDEDSRTVLPRGLGQYIIEELGVAPGPEVGKLRARCEEAIRTGHVSRDATKDDLIEFLRSSAA